MALWQAIKGEPFLAVSMAWGVGGGGLVEINKLERSRPTRPGIRDRLLCILKMLSFLCHLESADFLSRMAETSLCFGNIQQKCARCIRNCQLLFVIACQLMTTNQPGIKKNKVNYSMCHLAPCFFYAKNAYFVAPTPVAKGILKTVTRR